MDRSHRETVRRHRAAAGAVADRLVDEHALGGVGERGPLAPAALLGSAGLVVDQDRHALDLAQLALDFVELVAVMESDARRPFGAGGAFARLVTHPRHAAHAPRVNPLSDRPTMHAARRPPAAGPR